MKNFHHTGINCGFTLIELLIGVAILSIMLTIGIPSYVDSFDEKKLKTASEQVYSHLQQARVESISRSDTVTLNFSGAGTANWLYGIRQGAASCDLTKTSPTDNDACILVINDGDNVIDGINGEVDDDDKVLHRFTNTNFTNVSLSLTGFSNGSQITFDPLRGLADSGQINLTSSLGLKTIITVSALGLIKVCGPFDSSLTSCP